MAVPAFKAVWGAIALSPVGSIPTPSVKLEVGSAVKRAKTSTVGRIRITHRNSEVVIEMPLSAGTMLGTTLLFSLGFWYYAISDIIASMRVSSTDVETFQVVLLGAYSTIAFLTVAILFWMIAGSEKATVTRNAITIKRHVFGFGRTRKYRIDQLRLLNFEQYGKEALSKFGFGIYYPVFGGNMILHFPEKKVKFGVNVSEYEAWYILEAITRRGLLRKGQVQSLEEDAWK